MRWVLFRVCNILQKLKCQCTYIQKQYNFAQILKPLFATVINWMLNFKVHIFCSTILYMNIHLYFKKEKNATSQTLAGGHVTKDCQNGQNNYRIPKRLSKFYVHTKIFLIPPFVELWQNQKDKFCWSWYQLINVMMICIKRKNNIFNDLTMRKNWPKLEVSEILLPAENKKIFVIQGQEPYQEFCCLDMVDIFYDTMTLFWRRRIWQLISKD